jgi:hypothetical protein
MKINKYTKSSQEYTLNELVNEIVTNASDNAFERYWVEEEEEPEEVVVNKTNLTSHIIQIAELYGVKSAAKVAAQLNNQHGTGYTIQDIENIWQAIDEEWQSRQAGE